MKIIICLSISNRILISCILRFFFFILYVSGWFLMCSFVPALQVAVQAARRPFSMRSSGRCRLCQRCCCRFTSSSSSCCCFCWPWPRPLTARRPLSQLSGWVRVHHFVRKHTSASLNHLSLSRVFLGVANKNYGIMLPTLSWENLLKKPHNLRYHSCL